MVRFPFILSGDLKNAWSLTHNQGGGAFYGGVPNIRFQEAEEWSAK